MKWTPEQDETLQRLWRDGHSTSRIAERMGVTKNAIIGRAHRLDLARPSPIRRDGVRSTPRASQPPRAGKTTLPPLPSSVPIPTPPKPIFHAPIQAPEPVPSRPARNRDGTGCCYPIGEPGTKAFRFCDADLVSASYCREHHRLCCRRVAA